MTESAPAQRIAHRWYTRPVLFVTEVNRSLPFYIDKLGFEKRWHDTEGGVCQVNRSGCEIILCEDASRSGKSRLYVELTPDGLAALRNELVEQSISSENAWWGTEVVKLSDPDGNELLFPAAF